jgi:hypothetical protein
MGRKTTEVKLMLQGKRRSEANDGLHVVLL